MTIPLEIRLGPLLHPTMANYLIGTSSISRANSLSTEETSASGLDLDSLHTP
jgi:hypothetical protein